MNKSLVGINKSSQESPFEFKFDDKKEKLNKVAKILNLDVDDVSDIEIIDEKDNMIMVHYKETADMAKVGFVRGIVIDYKSGSIIAGSHGYTPIAVTDKIEFVDSKFDIIDKNGMNHSYSDETCKIVPSFEGVVIRALWYNNKFYTISFKKFDPSKSHWGKSEYFTKMYYDAGGPDVSQLFDTSKPYSNTYYTFLVCHKDLLVATRQQVNSPYIVYLGKACNDLKLPSDLMSEGIESFKFSTHMPDVVDKKFIFKPSPMKVNECNDHLEFGYYQKRSFYDDRMKTGESVIIYNENNGVVSDMIKINSKSFEWRSSMRADNPNISHQFYKLLSTVYSNPDPNLSSLSNYILFPPYCDSLFCSQIKNNGFLLDFKTATKYELQTYESDKDARIQLLWCNLIFSLPTKAQLPFLNVLDEYFSNVERVTEWIITIERKYKIIETTNYCHRVKNIISTSRRLARESVENNTNVDHKGVISLPRLIGKIIRNFVRKEKGTNLYVIIRDMKFEQTEVPKLINWLSTLSHNPLQKHKSDNSLYQFIENLHLPTSPATLHQHFLTVDFKLLQKLSREMRRIVK